jgi:hypothetical protein
MKNGVPLVKMQSREMKDLLQIRSSLTKFHQEARMNFTNGICSGPSHFSTESLIIIPESSKILVKQLSGQSVGKDARRLVNCCDCSKVAQCNNSEIFGPLDNIEESVRPFQDLKKPNRSDSG